jgi:hypothetical protein
MIKGLTLPYTGNKSVIIHKLSKCFPKRENFYDIFSGGFAVTSFMIANHYNKYSNFYANDINTMTIDLFKRAVSGEFNPKIFTPKWISKEEFHSKKNTDSYIRYIWSFGNNGKNYMFSPDIEEYKRSMHQAVVFDEFNDLVKESLKINKWPLKCNSIYKKRLYLRRKIEYYRINNCLPKVLRKYLSKGQLEQLKKINLNQLQRLQRLEQLQQLERLEQLQRLQQLQQLQQLEQLEGLERLQQLEGLERLQQLENKTLQDRIITKLEITNLDYSKIDIKPNSVVYCDPPYKGTFDYGVNFNTEKFLDWADSLNEIVFISEYNISDKRFSLFWSTKKRCSYSNGEGNSESKNKLVTEKLYINKYGKNKLMS